MSEPPDEDRVIVPGPWDSHKKRRSGLLAGAAETTTYVLGAFASMALVVREFIKQIWETKRERMRQDGATARAFIRRDAPDEEITPEASSNDE